MAEGFKITGAAEAERALRALPGQMGVRVQKTALRAGARAIQKFAKRRVRVKTGELKKSIRVGTKRGREAVVTVGPKWPQGAHGHLVEFGTVHSAPHPFLRPAFEEGKEPAVAAYAKELGRASDRAVNKLKGPAR